MYLCFVFTFLNLCFFHLLICLRECPSNTDRQFPQNYSSPPLTWISERSTWQPCMVIYIKHIFICNRSASTNCRSVYTSCMSVERMEDLHGNIPALCWLLQRARQLADSSHATVIRVDPSHKAFFSHCTVTYRTIFNSIQFILYRSNFTNPDLHNPFSFHFHSFIYLNRYRTH